MKNQYFKDEDILSLFSEGKKVEHSRELENVSILIDFDKKDNVVGVEIYEFSKALKKSQEFIDKLFAIPKQGETK